MTLNRTGAYYLVVLLSRGLLRDPGKRARGLAGTLGCWIRGSESLSINSNWSLGFKCPEDQPWGFAILQRVSRVDRFTCAI